MCIRDREYSVHSASVQISQAYEEREYGRAMRLIMQKADEVNSYVNDKAPWVLSKQDDKAQALQGVCTVAIRTFALLSLYLKPVLPRTIGYLEAEFLGRELNWQTLEHLDLPKVKSYQHVISRIDRDGLDKLVAANREGVSPTPAPDPDTYDNPSTKSATMDHQPAISIDDFTRIELRIARVDEASLVEGADKLLRLQLDVGELGRRQVFAGIKSSYDPAKLNGRLVVIVANLAPRKMRFGLSEGMVLAGSGENDADGIFLISPDSGAMPGMRVS